MLKYLGIKSRNDLGDYLTEKYPKGTGVEVGTHLAEYAAVILSKWNGTLYCIDPYNDAPDYDHQVRFLWNSNTDRNQDMNLAFLRLSKFQGRGVLINNTSAGAAPEFPLESVDFVYLDGNHMEPYVTQDIYIWWDRIKSGGLLLGHDFIMPGEPEDCWANYIQPAVQQFAAMNGLDIYLIPEPEPIPWSYALVKP